MRPASSRSARPGPSAVLAFSFVALAGVASVAACSSSSNQAAGGAGEAGAPVDLDVDTTGPCTSVGGTCESYAAGCPVLQQDTELCGNVVLVCCLPPGGEVIPVHDSGSTSPDSGDDSGPMNVPDTGTSPPPDSGSTKPPPDSGSTNPPPDSGSSNPPPDASTPKDASED
jgi:hypothetical protein